MKYIIVAALADETPGLEQFAPVIHTGVGKVNASIITTKAIHHYQPDLIINFGTAGSLTGLQGLHRVHTIVQHDIDVRPLGFSRGITPFSDNHSLPHKQGLVLATGDQFITNPSVQLHGLEIDVDLVDMEAFAIQTAAQHHHVDFHCYKFVSDDGNDDSVNDWQENVSKGAHQFADILAASYGRSALLPGID